MIKKVTVIGGGTGTFVVLSGLKQFDYDLGVIVTMMDSGGSTGRLRDQLGVLPPGDLRQCLVALSEASMLWRKLFLYRFESGDLAGHNFGNIFLSALEKVSGNYQEVIDTAIYVLKTKGKVIPVTFEKTHMCVKYASGHTVKGEGEIDKNYQEKTRVVEAFLEPSVSAHPKALNRIEESDYIILGPGDMYSSMIPVLLAKGIKEAIKKSRAKIIYVMNLMTKSGQTTNYTASDHLDDIKKYVGSYPDFVILNNGKIPSVIVDWYKRHNEHVVEDDLTQKGYPGRVIREDTVDTKVYSFSQKDKYVDPRVRSILRHDSKKLVKVIQQIIV